MSQKKLVGTYVPSQVVVVISHPATSTSHVVGGYGTDTVISIDNGDPNWESTHGVDGLHQRTHRLSNVAKATITLAQVSESNDFLSALATYDEQDLRGGGLFTCTITDKSGRSYIYSDQAYVVRPTTYDYSQSASTRDWVIVLPYAEQHLGGSTRMSAEHAATLEKLGIFIDDSWTN